MLSTLYVLNGHPGRVQPRTPAIYRENVYVARAKKGVAQMNCRECVRYATHNTTHLEASYPERSARSGVILSDACLLRNNVIYVLLVRTGRTLLWGRSGISQQGRQSFSRPTRLPSFPWPCPRMYVLGREHNRVGEGGERGREREIRPMRS